MTRVPPGTGSSSNATRLPAVLRDAALVGGPPPEDQPLAGHGLLDDRVAPLAVDDEVAEAALARVELGLLAEPARLEQRLPRLVGIDRQRDVPRDV